MPHCHIARITQMPNLKVECKNAISGPKSLKLRLIYRVQADFIGDFGWKMLYRFGCAKSLVARCRKHNIGVISGILGTLLILQGKLKKKRFPTMIWMVKMIFGPKYYD